jgi:hypothetical protein
MLMAKAIFMLVSFILDFVCAKTKFVRLLNGLHLTSRLLFYCLGLISLPLVCWNDSWILRLESDVVCTMISVLGIERDLNHRDGRYSHPMCG